MKTLLAITTYNQLKFTMLCINCLNKINIKGLDIIFIDDVSKDGTVKFLQESKFQFQGRLVPKGLTWSWNIAYRKFKNEGYDNLIIANNDILISQSALTEFLSVLKTNTFVVPLSTRRGSGHNWKEQAIDKYYPKLIEKSNRPLRHFDVQNDIKGSQIIQKKINQFNGFFFGMNRNIIPSEFDKENLFNPKLTNVGQESDLQKRLKVKPTLALRSFVFHFKGVSFPKKGLVNGKDIRQNLNLYH